MRHWRWLWRLPSSARPHRPIRTTITPDAAVGDMVTATITTTAGALATGPVSAFRSAPADLLREFVVLRSGAADLQRSDLWRSGDLPAALHRPVRQPGRVGYGYGGYGVPLRIRLWIPVRLRRHLSLCLPATGEHDRAGSGSFGIVQSGDDRSRPGGADDRPRSAQRAAQCPRRIRSW